MGTPKSSKKDFKGCTKHGKRLRCAEMLRGTPMEPLEAPKRILRAVPSMGRDKDLIKC